MNSPKQTLIVEDVGECLSRQQFKDKALKCKVISLTKLKYHPITTNPSTLAPRIKKQILTIMNEYMNKPDEEVDIEFNEIVNGEILACGIAYETYDVINSTSKQDAICMNSPEDPPSEKEYIEPVSYTSLTPDEMWRM
jgi:hypothetical protein